MEGFPLFLNLILMGPQAELRHPGRPFQGNSWLTLDMDLGLSDRQYNLEKAS